MRKLTFLLTLLIVVTGVNAQSVVVSNYGKDSIAEKNKGVQEIPDFSKDSKSWKDYTVDIDFKKDNYGFMFGSSDQNSMEYINMSLSFTAGDFPSGGFAFGYGAHYRYDSESFMFLAALYPYVGFLMYTSPKADSNEKETKTKFEWGASANVRAGLKLFSTSKGNDYYLTLGYYFGAPDFKTKDMLDNGSWCVGLSLKY